jgi:spermidine synthase
MALPANRRPTPRPADSAVLGPLLLVSGAAALAYEVLWARDWALIYGSTAVGTAIVLAVYFAGLALGAALAARASGERRDLRLYAALEVGVAVAVLSYVAARPALPSAAVWVTRATPVPLVPVARTLLAAAVLAVPAALLGATLPAATGVLAPGDAAGAGRLYVWNTVGGALGAVATGLLAIRALGARGAFITAAALDLAVAAAAFAVRSVAPAPAAASRAAPIPRAALAIAAVAGFAGLADEVLWTRGLAGVLSNSVYSITLVLAAVLLGLVVGARLGVVAMPRRDGNPTRLAVVLAALAITTIGSGVALRGVGAASVSLARAFGVRGPGAGLAAELLLALGVVVPPTIALGAAFPLVLAFAGAERPGRTMARVLAANTAAAIAGALLAAFVLLPRLGLGGALATTAFLPAIAAVLLAPRHVAGWLAVAAVGIAAVVAPSIRLRWRGGDSERVLFYRDGAAATVTVTADAHGTKRLRVNGQYSLGGGDGVLLERREAHLPLLLHPGPRRLLALGVGTGDTLGAALAHPGLRADGIELVSDVLEAARLFASENGGVLTDPRARLVVDDARSRLLATEDRYDVILSDLFLPWTAGTATLYSVDLYRLGQRRLLPGGLYCQWLPLHQLGTADLEEIVASFVAVFPHVSVWVAYHRTTTPLAALVGSDKALDVSTATVGVRFSGSTLAPALARVGLDDPSDLGVLYVTDGRRLAPVVADVAPITDDRPRIEFTAPAAYFHQEGLARAALAWVAARLDPAPAPIANVTFALRATLLRAQLALLDGDRPAELAAYLDALAMAPDVPTVRRALTSIAEERRAAGDRITADRIMERLGRAS